MRLNDLLEARIDPHTLGGIIHGPAEYLHYAHTPEDVRSIVQRGFDLKRFGYTAKKYNMRDMMATDPLGVFATTWEEGYVDRSRPWVRFSLSPLPNILAKDVAENGFGANLKMELNHAYGVAGARLTKLLLASDIQGVLSQSEWIILDTNRIRITGNSLDNPLPPRRWR